MADDISNRGPVPVIEAGGEERRLGLLQPSPGYEDDAPLLTATPGFRTWTRQEIEDFIRNKPYGSRRTIFTPDWMQDQKKHGSCNACAAAYVQRKGQYLRGRLDTPMLNWEFLYAQINGGRDNGSLLKDGMEAVQSIGIPILDSSRHRIGADRIFKNQFTPEEYAAAQLNRTTKSYAINDELTLATAVLSGFCAVVAVHVGSSFSRIDRKGFAGADPGAGNHSIHVDDVVIVNGVLGFDHQGSWGVNIHDQGRALLSWDRHLKNTNRYHKFWIAVSTNDGDDPLTK